MLTLAVESTAVTASVCIAEEEAPLALFTVSNKNTHSENLLPMIESSLLRLSLSMNDIGLFALSAGPGSFTGVRIGAATVKGLAFGKDKPCVAVSTLEALAYNLVGFEDRILCPVMNARRGQVYNALFEAQDGTLTRLTPDRALSVTELEAELRTIYAGREVMLSGDGYDLTKQAFLDLPSPIVCPGTPVALRAQSAYSVAMIGQKMYKEGNTVSDSDLKPFYLRLSQAERERLERENPGGIKM